MTIVASEATEREYEEWQRDNEPVQPFKKLVVDLKGTLVDRFKAYLKQKDRERASGVEVEEDIKRMRVVFRMALEGELDDSYIESMFPEPSRSAYPCPICGGEGMYLSTRAKFRWRGETIERPGYVVCHCEKGRAKNHAIAHHGKEKKKHGGRDFR